MMLLIFRVDQRGVEGFGKVTFQSFQPVVHVVDRSKVPIVMVLGTKYHDFQTFVGSKPSYIGAYRAILQF